MRSLLIILLLGATCLSASAQRFIKVFDNVAALLAANQNDVHTNAWVAGRASANDGGGGIYTWHSASTASTNSNLGVLKANNFSTGRWFRDNGFRLTDFPVNYAVVVGPDGILTNGAITVVELNRLSGVSANIQAQIDSLSGGSSNWVDEGATNATLPGIARSWKNVVTNSLEVGQPNEQGLITLVSTNATSTNQIFVNVDGLLTFTSAGTPIVYFGDEGSIYARRLLAISNVDLNADDIVRIQPSDLLINVGTTTNDFFIDMAAGTIRMRHEGTNTFFVAQDSGYGAGGIRVLTDQGGQYLELSVIGGADDQTAAEVPNTPAGTIAATDVQAALNELDTDKAAKATTITIAGTANEITSSAGAQDLSANRTWTLSLPSSIDLGGKTLEIPNGNDPDLSVEGQISYDANGDVLRVYDGANQVAIGRKIEAIHVVVVSPNDLADSERDAFWVWSNESGMSFIVTGWKAWSDTDDTDLNIEEIDGDGANNATVDAVSITTNGTGLFYGSDTTITAATIENGHLLVLDFDDTDTPGQVKITITGYFDANVN